MLDPVFEPTYFLHAIQTNACINQSVTNPIIAAAGCCWLLRAVRRVFEISGSPAPARAPAHPGIHNVCLSNHSAALLSAAVRRCARGATGGGAGSGLRKVIHRNQQRERPQSMTPHLLCSPCLAVQNE